jgi:hypothetical protein
MDFDSVALGMRVTCGIRKGDGALICWGLGARAALHDFVPPIEPAVGGSVDAAVNAAP